MEWLHLNSEYKNLIFEIVQQTARNNKDNISRTNAYYQFYKKHPEIQWSFLASMVSRNGGYNMCDLKGELFPPLLSAEVRKQLFLTYERANWLIFQDAFPQLLLYHYSTIIQRPLFHLFPQFHISVFIQKEWERFWIEKDKKRLMTSLIINEQNVIQLPVLDHPVYQNRVFRTWMFYFQDWLHFCSVLFPTCDGEIYGASVNGFRKLSKRIDLGKRLSDILFDPSLYRKFVHFSEKTVHTGSRHDYEQYLKTPMRRNTPFLRTAFPLIEHHQHKFSDWSLSKKVPESSYSKKILHKEPIHITRWYMKKRYELELIVLFKKWRLHF